MEIVFYCGSKKIVIEMQTSSRSLFYYFLALSGAQCIKRSVMKAKKECHFNRRPNADKVGVYCYAGNGKGVHPRLMLLLSMFRRSRRISVLDSIMRNANVTRQMNRVPVLTQRPVHLAHSLPL